MYLFLERGEGKEKERERNINVWLPLMHPKLGTWPATQGMCPDWESIQGPFSLQANTQPTEPHRPGHIHIYLNSKVKTRKKGKEGGREEEGNI